MKKEIPKQPEGFTKNMVWFASYHTIKFVVVILTVVVSIILLSIKYEGKTIKKDSIDVMEKLNERKN